MKPTSLLAIAGRKSPTSTELYVQAESDLDTVFVERWGVALIGYARLIRAQWADEVRGDRSVATFELAEVLSSRSPCPDPLVSLSAVLWSRRGLLAGLSGCRSSVHQEDLQLEPLLRSVGGACPHEA